MKIVVIGGLGLIGSKVISKLKSRGYEVVAADLRNGVNNITGEGLSNALIGAQKVGDVANSPSESLGGYKIGTSITPADNIQARPD